MTRAGLLGLALVLFASTAFAQDTGIPSVDAIDETPEEKLVAQTMGLYDAIIAAGKIDCPTMAVVVRDYIDAHEDEIERAANALADVGETMTDADKASLAAYLTDAVRNDPRSTKAQKKLYPCLRSGDIQGYKRPLDKQMHRFYRLHQRLMDVLVGNVD